jgi:succinate-semialdehyde dehydrogenase/glutarate-semialdehyde dehydrogenase
VIETVNPATGEVLAHYETHDGAATEHLLGRAWALWRDEWRHRTLDDRLEVLAAAGKVLDDRRDELAELITCEMGKPISGARAEVEKCAWLCRHYAEHAPAYLEPQIIATEALHSYVRYDPIGPILAIMPWNFPLWQVFRFAIPNLAAGNVGLLKHAPITTGSALAVQDLFEQAGLPEGAFTTLLIDHDATADVIADRRVRGVTLTGSDRAGRAVSAAAGRSLKKTVLELGGSDPCIVLADADLDRAARAAVASRYLNTGQSCINAKRMIVVDDVYDEFLERFRVGTVALTLGDPMDERTDLGPLARGDLRDSVHDQVQRTLSHPAGGQLVIGGEPVDGPGYFYPATIISDVAPDAPAAAEEVFGPVAAFMRAASEDAAIDLANDSMYGLGAAVWTNDIERGQRLAARIESGAVFVNDMVKSDPRLPFGGVKESGYGRELAREGVIEFTNTKTVWVAGSATAPGNVE